MLLDGILVQAPRSPQASYDAIILPIRNTVYAFRHLSLRFRWTFVRKKVPHSY